MDNRRILEVIQTLTTYLQVKLTKVQIRNQSNQSDTRTTLRTIEKERGREKVSMLIKVAVLVFKIILAIFREIINLNHRNPHQLLNASII